VDNYLPYAVVLGLVLLNGLFVAAEFAIVGAPRATMDRLAERGSRAARLVQRILRTPRLQDRFIATAQLGITVASLGLGMYGEHAIAERIAAGMTALRGAEWAAAHAVASVISIALLTYLHIVLGEMIPKSIALQHAGTSALWITPPMRWIELAVLPIVVGLNGLGNSVLRLFGIHRQITATEQYYTSEELQLVVEESEEGGAIRSEAGQMLLELFEFGDLTAGEAMVPRVSVVGIPADASAEELRDILRETPHTRYPVYEHDLDHILGMVHIKDVLRVLIADQTLSAARIRPLPVVPETAPLDAVLASMKVERTQMATVIDEHGGTAGTITLADLFEEVVGEIDESVTDIPDIRELPDGRLHVLGAVRLGEVGQRFDLDLQHEDVDSVSGLVLMLLGRPPRVGDVVEFGRVRIHVSAVRGRGVAEAIVECRTRET
jgi:CBS domain containing-hemolysin-like protein